MGQYAEQVSGTKLFKQLDALVGREDVTAADVVKLKQLVLAVADAVGPHLDRIRATFWQYTEHDLRHLCNVADLVYRFLPKAGKGSKQRVRLNAVELAFLWIAILLHDVGMYVSDTEKQEALDSEDYRNYLRHQPDRVEAAQKARTAGLEVKARAIEDALLAEYFRRLHPERVRVYIAERLRSRVPLEFRGVDLEDDLGDLCESHAWGVRESNDPRNLAKCVARLERNRRVGPARVNLQYLACCLRLGDILDFDKSRTPLTVYGEIDFTEAKSAEEWNKHLSIDGWDVTENRLLFDARCTHPAYYVAVHDFLNWIDDELRECRYLADEVPAGDEEKYSLGLAHAVDRRQVRMRDPKYVAGGFRFRLEYDEIMRLLMDKSLYPDASLFLRELLQNSLDACRYQQALAKEAGMEDKYIPRIIVWDYSQDEKNPRIVFQDNGIGMSQHQVENFFLRVGKSFYKSPEFAAERQRLADKGIHFDACSQFGIGFLSCFLAGDLIEVETFRFGSTPLRVTITGQSKYFVIERLKELGSSIRFKSPENHLEDGPPKHPGTRAIVHLRKCDRAASLEDDRGVAWQTLEAFAVNQCFEIHVIEGAVGAGSAIPEGRWDRSEAMPPKISIVSGIVDMGYEWLGSSILVPAVFSLHDYFEDLRGGGAIWMLRGPGDRPSPACGGLRLSGSQIQVVASEPLFLSRLFAFAESFASSIRDRVWGFFSENLPALHADKMKFERESAHFELSMLQNAFDLQYSFRCLSAKAVELSPSESEWIVEVCEKMAREGHHAGRPILGWSSDLDIAKAFLREEWRQVEPRLWIADLLRPIFLSSAYELSLFGVRVPAGLAFWDPERAVAKRPEIAPNGVTVRVDAYGSLAPQPSASRLFVPIEGAARFRTSVGLAILHHVLALYQQHRNDPEWARWLSSFLGECDVIHFSVFEELRELQNFLLIPCMVDGKLRKLALSEVCELFGDSALAVERRGAAREGLLVDRFDLESEEEPFEPHWLVNHMPRRTLSDGQKVLDLTAIRSRVAA